MTLTQVTSKRSRPATPALAPMPESRVPARRRIRMIPFLITLGTLTLAAILGSAAWGAYMGAPWTRDATVRAYVVTMAPEVAGRIVELHVADNDTSPMTNRVPSGQGFRRARIRRRELPVLGAQPAGRRLRIGLHPPRVPERVADGRRRTRASRTSRSPMPSAMETPALEDAMPVWKGLMVDAAAPT